MDLFRSLLLSATVVAVVFCLFSLGVRAGERIPQPPLVNRAAVFDFDGDRKSDVAVVRSEQDQIGFKKVWYIRGSNTGMIAAQWGDASMQIAPADYDGDGKWDIAVWGPIGGQGSQGYFYILRSSDRTLQIVALGTANDSPFETQDFDGDGKADPTVTHCDLSTGDRTWSTVMSRTGQLRQVQYGFCDDRPLRGDFDGDGKADIAVYRVNDEQNQYIILQTSNNVVRYVLFGRGNDDRVTSADFDGDGKTDLVVMRILDDVRVWYWIESSTGQVRGRQYGLTSTGSLFDGPVPGDYDGDGKTDFAVWRTIDSQLAWFYVEGSRIGPTSIQWGVGFRENAPAGLVQFR